MQGETTFDHIDYLVDLLFLQDDLGRVRQDELPLSTRLRNGPSFISNYDHYANRYDEPFKDGLLTNWSGNT